MILCGPLPIFTRCSQLSARIYGKMTNLYNRELDKIKDDNLYCGFSSMVSAVAGLGTPDVTEIHDIMMLHSLLQLCSTCAEMLT
jgi:hypothetical protein